MKKPLSQRLQPLLIPILLWVVFVVLLAAIVSGSAFGASYERTFTNRVRILPPRVAKPTTAWVTNTVYTQGAYVRNLNRNFMCLKAGTSAVSGVGPVGTGIVTNDGTAEWISMTESPRTHWSVQKKSGGTVTISEDPSVTNTQDWELQGDQDLLGESGVPQEVYQDALYTVSTSSYTISVRER